MQGAENKASNTAMNNDALMDHSGLHNDPLQAYERALRGLSAGQERSPLTLRALQHAAVLALAQCGATDFALREYERYGLSACHDDEDVMALVGRLYKDLYLTGADDAKRAYARKSEEAYHAAHESTGGYYSAVNAATMGLIAGEPTARTAERAAAILQALPAAQDLTPELHYFIEATRAECYWLQGKPAFARDSLRSAVRHDPLNFGAHATTLKQFKMIASIRSDKVDWLNEFSPPTSMHYAGHNFALSDALSGALPSLTYDQCAQLILDTEDAVQRADIGFGFGALAAGSDIIIAEALLVSGAQLHVTLPAPVDDFIKSSVEPYGEVWIPRFHACLSAASRVHIATDDKHWPSLDINSFCGTVAIGQAKIRAAILAAPTAQMVIWDARKEGSYTARQVEDGERSGLPLITVPYPGSRKVSPNAPKVNRALFHMHVQGNEASTQIDKPLKFDTPQAAAQAAFERHSQTQSLCQIAIEVSLPMSEEADAAAEKVSREMVSTALPGLTLLSENAACIFAAGGHANYSVHLIGVSENGERRFALKPR